MASSDTKPQETILGGCLMHPDCRVLYDVDECPVCKTVIDLKCNHTETRGANKFLKGEVARLKKVEKENTKLQSRIFELEEQLDNSEDDAPCEEPQRPGDMGASRGTEVSPRSWGEGCGTR